MTIFSGGESDYLHVEFCVEPKNHLSIWNLSLLSNITIHTCLFSLVKNHFSYMTYYVISCIVHITYCHIKVMSSYLLIMHEYIIIHAVFLSGEIF